MTPSFQLETQEETTRFLLEIAEAANAPLDLDGLLARIAAVVKKAIDCEIFAILLLNERTQELRVRFDIGHRPEVRRMRIPLGKGVTGTAAAERRPVLVNDVSRFPGYIAALESVRSELAVPMILKDRVIGVIDIQSTEPDYFTERHRDLVSLVAGRVALSVENARLYRSTARQARTLATLVEIAREFSSLLRINELLPKIAELVRRLIGYDAFSILLLDESQQVLRHYFSMRFNERVKELTVIPMGQGICGNAAVQRQALLVPDVTKDPRYLACNLETRSELAVPLVVRDKVIGVLDLESTRKGSFTNSHRQMMELLAPQVAVSIENARLYEKIAREEARMERDLAMARELQRHLLPKCCPDIPGLELAARYEPAREIGGDLYDFLQHPGTGSDRGLVLFTGDVSGKGAAAALYAALVSGVLRGIAGRRLSPGEMLEALNDSLTERQIESRYVALTCAYLDLDTRMLELANAGLPPPILCRDGQFLPARVEGVPLGLLKDRKYETKLVQLEPGDVAVFYTDGVLENLNPAKEEYGRRRLAELVRTHCYLSAGVLLQRIFQDLEEWSQGLPLFDDQTVLVLRVLPKA